MNRILRWFLLFLAAVLTVTAGYARFIEPELLTVRSFAIETEKPVAACKIVFFTDTHFGKYYGTDHVENIVKQINELKADIVIFGGDLLDNYARDRESIDLEYLKTELAKIDAKAGKYAVWGNHDYGGGAVRVYEDIMTSGGFELLDDESRFLEDYGLKVTGYDDYLMGWTDPSLYRPDDDMFHVIAAHEPVISELIDGKGESFLLSGHTHGGQVRIPFLTSKLLPEGSGQYVKGFYTVNKMGTDLQMYTSSGIGMTRYPLRFGNIPEIVEVNLMGGSSTVKELE